MEFVKEKGVGVIFFYYDFNGILDFGKFLMFFEDMEELEFEIIKIVIIVNFFFDNLRVLRFYEYVENFIVFCMGFFGRIFRVFLV